jgi:hypothetical protein
MRMDLAAMSSAPFWWKPENVMEVRETHDIAQLAV